MTIVENPSGLASLVLSWQALKQHRFERSGDRSGRRD